MIKRRTFLKSVIGVAAASLTVKGIAEVPADPAVPSPIGPGVAADSGSVIFTIHGWDVDGLHTGELEGRQVVPLYLPRSWRSSWM